MLAMITDSGTACAETALCPEHDNSKMRQTIEAGADADASRWENCDNPELECQVCGKKDDGQPIHGKDAA
jgi:hypothetical protein